MSTVEVLSIVARTDLALSAGVLAVLALRLPARRWLGVRIAYSLWLIPLIAVAAVLVPPRIVTVPAPAPLPEAVATPPLAIAPASLPVVTTAAASRPWIEPMSGLAVVWLAGAAGAAAWFARGQRRFLDLARQGLAGPAAVGVIRPRVIVPAEFEQRFSRSERAAILAHEAAHIALQHPRANALAAAVQALHWFNPLTHLAAHLMRIDQELACDAAVVGERPKMRRLYAETLLKSQLSATPLPFGCYWPPRSEHPLTRRVEMLNRAVASRGLRRAGGVGVAALILASGVAAWAAQPARTVVGPETSFTMKLTRSDDPNGHTPAGQAAYQEGLRLAKGLASDTAKRFAEHRRWAVEHFEPAPSLITYALQDRARQAWPAPARDADRSLIFLTGRLDLGAGQKIAIDLPRVQYGMTTQRTDDRDGHSEIAQPTRTPAGADIRLAIGLADGRTLFTPAMAFKPGETKSLRLADGAQISLTARFAAPPPQPKRVQSLELKDPPEGLSVVADQVTVQKDGRVTVYTGHVQVMQNGAGILADKVTVRLSERTYRSNSRRAAKRLREARNNYAAAQREFEAGKITQAALVERERQLHKTEAEVRMTQPSAASPQASPGRSARDTAADMSRALVANVQKGSADYERQPRIPPGAFERDLNAPVHIRGMVLAYDETAPRARVHLADIHTGVAWVVEVGSANTLRRGGITQMVGQTIDIDAHRAKDPGCQPECKAVLRQMTFPDGRKIFLGVSGTQPLNPPSPKDDKTSALNTGDWRKAAALGAGAADIVRALQAKGGAAGINPNEAVVVLPADGGPPEITAMKPLPPLPGGADEPAPLNGTGFSFSKPGAIILYPPGSRTFGSGADPSRPNAVQPIPPVLRRFSGEVPQPVAPMTQPPILRRSGPGSETGQPLFTPVSNPAPPASRPPPGWRPFAAVFDGNAPVLLKGTVTGLEWTNPRILFHMVDTATGQAWAIEGVSPEVMAANGMTRDQLAKGTQVVVRGYQAKNKECRPECLANARDVSFPDGQKRFVGRAGTAAP